MAASVTPQLVVESKNADLSLSAETIVDTNNPCSEVDDIHHEKENANNGNLSGKKLSYEVPVTNYTKQAVHQQSNCRLLQSMNNNNAPSTARKSEAYRKEDVDEIGPDNSKSSVYLQFTGSNRKRIPEDKILRHSLQ
jgi:hypothetical protein